jgi:hypothetical protein
MVGISRPSASAALATVEAPFCEGTDSTNQDPVTRLFETGAQIITARKQA